MREANASPAGRRNGGAMLMALANEKALLTTLVRVHFFCRAAFQTQYVECMVQDLLARLSH